MSSQTPSTPRQPFKEILPTTGPSTSDQPPEAARVHPDFSDEDTDIVLCSQEGIHFRVHSIILKVTSGWFRTLFTLPQSPTPTLESSSSTAGTSSDKPPTSSSQRYKEKEVIPMNESSEILEVLLSMVCGKEIPVQRLHTIDFIEDLLQVVEKYDMPGAASIVRLALSLTLIRTHPIRVYAIACRWGWADVAKAASSHTLHMDLLGPEVMQELAHVGSAHLARLMALHRRRRDQLRRELDSTDLFYANVVPGKCTGCNTDINHARWHALKYAWVAMLEEQPVLVAEKDLLERAELWEVLESKCPRCQKSLYNAESTLHNLRSILEKLPTTVEVSRQSTKTGFI